VRGRDHDIGAQQVDGTEGELLRDRAELDRGPWCLLLEDLQERTRHRGEDVVRRPDVKSAVARLRVEHRPQVEGALDLAERIFHERLQLHRARREVERPAVSHQERIADEAPQLGERAAHCRLRHADGRARARQAALGEHRVEHDDQIQVDAPQVVHPRHPDVSLPRS